MENGKNLSRLDEVKNGLVSSGVRILGEDVSTIQDGKKGKVIDWHTIQVDTNGLDNKYLLAEDEKIYRWDEPNGRLRAFEVHGNHVTSIVIEMMNGQEHRI